MRAKEHNLSMKSKSHTRTTEARTGKELKHIIFMMMENTKTRVSNVLNLRKSLRKNMAR